MLIKALTLHQPWATLIAVGAKRIETRSWGTNYRGLLAIHAGKNPAYFDLINTEPFSSVLNAADALDNHLPTGAIVAICELVGVDRFGAWIDRKPMLWQKGRYQFELSDQERAFGDYSIGRYGLFLANIRRIDPIPCRGAQGLWDYDWDGSHANS